MKGKVPDISSAKPERSFLTALHTANCLLSRAPWPHTATPTSCALGPDLKSSCVYGKRPLTVAEMIQLQWDGQSFKTAWRRRGGGRHRRRCWRQESWATAPRDQLPGAPRTTSTPQSCSNLCMPLHTRRFNLGWRLSVQGIQRKDQPALLQTFNSIFVPHVQLELLWPQFYSENRYLSLQTWVPGKAASDRQRSWRAGGQSVPGPVRWWLYSSLLQAGWAWS